MKKISVLACVLVLTATLFTACRGKNKPMETTKPTTAPTTQATTMPTTEATQPSTAATQPRETTDHGNGPVDGTNGTDSTGTTDSTVEGRSVGPRTRSR